MYLLLSFRFIFDAICHPCKINKSKIQDYYFMFSHCSKPQIFVQKVNLIIQKCFCNQIVVTFVLVFFMTPKIEVFFKIEFLDKK